MSRELEQRVLMLPPTVKDGEVTRALLKAAGVECELVGEMAELVHALEGGAGALLLTEEALTGKGVEALTAWLTAQPAWSDLPVVVLMRGGMASEGGVKMLESWRNVTLLERPAPIRSVVSAVKTAVRSRRRQYELRDQLVAIQEGERRFQAMANSIPQLAWMARSDGWIFWYNQRWHDYCGTTPEQMEGWGWQGVHDPSELPRVMARWKHAVDHGEPWEDTFPLRRHDGEMRWHLSRAMPFRDADGRITLWFGTNTDVTDARRLGQEQEQLWASERAAREEAERVSRMKDEFLATLSHELRTPLNAIFGWTQLLKTAPDTQTLAEGVAVIDRNVRVQTQLIEDLLDMSRIISGKIRLNLQPVELDLLISGALEGVRPAAEAKGIVLEKEVAPGAGTVNGDPGRLQQVLWNLLTNAIKFTPPGGRIAVRAARALSHVELRVTDTGEGISPEFLPLMFQRFSQADASTTRKHGGLGLGLSIVKSLVEMHGGMVEAASPGQGQGATFLVRLPAGAAPPEAREAGIRANDGPRGMAGRNLRGVKVLVVDDEADARDVVRRFLLACEAVPALAGSAAEAREVMARFKPDVILSDIGMPGQDGYAFMRAVRESGITTPAVAVTAFARSEDRVKSLQAGFQTHLPKPVEPEELLAVIAGLAGVSTGVNGSKG
jgi:PAS domain S-box-containing protein